jgi:hypothetical protein
MNISENRWEENLPKLNLARAAASGCHLGGYYFVFGGGCSDLYNSIEKVCLRDLVTGEAVWQLI